MRIVLPVCLILLTACSQPPDASDSYHPLDPYSTQTPIHSPSPAVLFADTLIPTATPIAYVIREGDTISQLAEKYNLTQDDLLAVNPDVNPSNLTIGETLLIPSGRISNASTPTPVPVLITQTICHPSADGGMWCFALVFNNTSTMVEDISVQFLIKDPDGAIVASQAGFLPLDILPPGTSLPAFSYFLDAPAAGNLQVQLLSAYQPVNPDARFLPAVLDNTLAEIDQNGRNAMLSGRIHLPEGTKAATRVLVAAVAYDSNGMVVGVRRWEGGPIQPGASIPFQFLMASAGTAIDAVDFVLQATP